MDVQPRRSATGQRDRVLEVARDAHADLQPTLQDGIRAAYTAAPRFADTFDRWVRVNDLGDTDRADQFAIAATRMGVRLLVRSLLDERQGGGAGDPVGGMDSPGWPGLLDDLPENKRISARLCDFRRELHGHSIDRVDVAVIASLYESVVPDGDRSVDGQFYTPPAIASTLVQWAVPADAGDGIPTVLDPAAGTGVFAVHAYRRLADHYPDASHRDLLDHVIAVDVNPLPLRLAALSLAAAGRRGGIEDVRAHPGSFFDLDPEAVGPVDAVVGNPPYVQADAIADREQFRAHLRAVGPDGAAPYLEGPGAISRAADAYVYFVTHATRFLREGGRLGMILPTKWLSARYGEDFLGFLRDHYRLRAVIGFDTRAFEDALVETALILLERSSTASVRAGTTVEFLRIAGTPAGGEVLGSLQAMDFPASSGPEIAETAVGRSVRVRQDRLETGTRKPAHYLDAPDRLLRILGSPNLVPLGDLADVTRGAMTGSTAFFFPEMATADAYGIEDTFRRPAVKSIRDADTALIEGSTVDRCFVDVHRYVDAVRRRDDGEGPLEDRVTASLADDGYTGLLDWIRHAERHEEHTGATCGGREVWFDFGEPPRPAILFQKLLRERFFAMYNRAGAVPSNAVDCIDVHPGVDAKAVFGVLNAALTHAIMEVWGRNEAGMLQLMTYETRSLPVPDLRSMTDRDRQAIVAAVDGILADGGAVTDGPLRDRLDAAVLAAIDLPGDPSVAAIQELHDRLRSRRLDSGEAGVVVSDDG